MALTQNGEVWVWGSGPCLGLGSAEAVSLAPQLLEELAERDVFIVDICIGDSHVLGTHELINLHISTMAYYINTLGGERSVHVRCEPKCFKDGDLFLKNMYLTLCQFLKKNLIRYVLWKVSNFALIFYVMSVLHKKSR